MIYLSTLHRLLEAAEGVRVSFFKLHYNLLTLMIQSDHKLIHIVPLRTWYCFFLICKEKNISLSTLPLLFLLFHVCDVIICNPPAHSCK